jgi:hypothetical protein
MMKIIMPMARLAASSVAQELAEPTRGSISSAKAAGSSTGRKSRFGFGKGPAAVVSVTGVSPG